jgi:hypothetical protein
LLRKKLDLCSLTIFCFFLVPQAKEVLQSFLQSQAAVEKSILQSDKALTEGENAITGTLDGSSFRGVSRFLQSPS